MSDCTCGFGGFHEELNTRCALYAAPSPYRFTVSAYCGDGNWWWVALNGSDVLWDEPFATEAEAREHAALVLAALHQATMEEP